jgi:hypothetical protein
MKVPRPETIPRPTRVVEVGNEVSAVGRGFLGSLQLVSKNHPILFFIDHLLVESRHFF